jgi:acetyl-CoA carboxylase biotin carboxyl carrier protein
MKPDIAFIEKLVELFSKNDMGELEVQFNRNKWVRISKVAGGVAVQSAPVTPVIPAAPAIPATETGEGKPEKPARPANLVAVKSPMIGTFYRASAPDAPAYVEVGDTVKPGTVLCIVEAMKLMNEIEAESSGKIVEILVDNESPVEYGQEMFLIEPS